MVREQDAPHYRADALSLGSESDPTLESLLEVLRGFVDENVELGPDTRLEDAGVNSLAAVELAGRLSARFSISLPPWIISDYQTPRALISQLTGRPQENSQSAELSHEDTKVVTTDRLLERPHRILFLHGEAADAELMDLSMQAAHWSGMLEGQVEFLFIDTPHRCGPEPKFHRSAVESGLYQKREYRSWKTTQTEALEKSIEATLSVIDEQGPVDGIGGICEGGLVAALVAARRPEIKFYLNIASSPPARLASMKSEVVWPTVCPSLHLLSPNDELFSYQELLEIPSHCQKATMIAQGNRPPWKKS